MEENEEEAPVLPVEEPAEPGPRFITPIAQRPCCPAGRR